MKLSDLVKLRANLVQYADYSKAVDEARKVNDNLRSLLGHCESPEYYNELANAISGPYDMIIEVAKHAEKKLDTLIDNINTEIAEITKGYLIAGYKSFVTSIEDERENRLLPLSDVARDTLIGRIRAYSDWHYPGMEIGPREGDLTTHLVGCDPLYLVDVRYEYMDSIKAKFSEEYQARIRTYHIGNLTNEKGLAELPQNQFGFVLSWNMFNYLPLEEIKKYLFDVFGVLRPGGTFLFSFNDGDTYNGARHVEWGGMSYTPKSLLIPIIEGHGFELATSYNFDSDWHSISWLEIKKPGTLSTIKAHQNLGMIKNIT